MQMDLLPRQAQDKHRKRKLLSERNKSANFPGMHTGGGKPASTSTSISQIFGGLEVLKQPGPMLRTTLVGKVCGALFELS
jgi:hypothetical protein